MDGWLSDRLSNLWDWFTDIGVQLLWAAGIVAAILIGARWLRRRLNRALRARSVNPNAVNLINIFSKVIVYTIVLVVLLRVFGVTSSSLVTVVGLVSAAVTLSLQDVLKNLVSGVYLLMEQPFRVGDRIEVTTQKGIVQKVDIRTTVLLNDEGEHVLVPNYKVFSEIVLNRTSHIDLPDRFTVEGLSATPTEVKKALAQISEVVPVAKAPVIEIVKAGPDKIDYEISVSWKANAADRLAFVTSLREHFPEATITRVTG